MNDDQYGELMGGLLSLRDATAHGFALVETQFEQVDKRFEAMQADMNRRFDRVDDRFDAVDKRFDRLEMLITQMKPKRKRPQDRD